MKTPRFNTANSVRTGNRFHQRLSHRAGANGSPFRFRCWQNSEILRQEPVPPLRSFGMRWIPAARVR